MTETIDTQANPDCSICGGEITPEPVSGWTGGHNAEPVNDGRCCTVCNDLVVIPARLNRLALRDAKG